MRRILKQRDPLLDAIFFALRAILLIVGLTAAYIGTNHWTAL